MSQQRDIFNKLKAVQSTQSLPAYESPASYKMDNMNITDFLFELIKQTKGQDGLKNIVLKSTLGELNGGMNINMTIINIIREVFFCLFDIIIPASVTVGQQGFIVQIPELDPTNKMLSVDPNSPEGRHLYDSNDPTKSLNCLIYSAQNATTVQNAVPYKKNGKVLFTIFYLGGNQMQVNLGAEYANQKLSLWAEDYLRGLSFFNMPNFLAELVDIITGVVSIKTKKTTEEFQQDAAISKVLSLLFGFCQNKDDPEANTRDTGVVATSPTTYLQNQEDKKRNGTTSSNLFDFSPDDVFNMEDIANLRQQGKIRFATCGNFEVEVSPDDMLNKMDQLFGDRTGDTFTIYMDPITGVESSVPETYDNEIVAPNINDTAAFLNNIVADSALPSSNPDSGDSQGTPSANSISFNLPNMEMEFELSIIKAIPFALTQQIINPQLLLLIKTASVIIGEQENNGVFTIQTIIDKLVNVISKIGQDIWNSLLNNIFKILVGELTGILTGVATAYLSQQASSYLSVLSFLVNLIKGLNLKANGCQSMLDIIMQLLSLNYFGPQLPIPPPLIYAGGMLKPGMNEVSAVNSLKSKLSGMGMEVGATMSDGTPNYLMAALEATLKTGIAEVRNASGQVFTMGTTGPAMGYAQLL